MNKVTKGTISRIESGQIVNTFTFMFNPTEISRSRETNWAKLEAPGTAGALAQFVRTGSESIDLKLFLASKRSGSRLPIEDVYGVQPYLSEIESWMLPSLDQFQEFDSHFIAPPQLLFTYGSRTWTCVADNIDVVEKQHNKELFPTVAEVSLRLTAIFNTFDDLRDLVAEHIFWRSQL